MAKDGVGWYSTSGSNDIWVDQSSYKTGDIVCGKDYLPGTQHAKVAAGGTVTLTWLGGPPNHRGPIVDYLANCNGPCGNVNKMNLDFFKVQEMGLIRPNEGPENGGFWATDLLVKSAKKMAPQEGSPPDKMYGEDVTWKVNIPSCLAPGNYVLRHEIIALFDGDRVQHYPRCINLEVTGNGREQPKATPVSELYNVDMPGIKVRAWQHLQNYTIPGPELYKGCDQAVAQQAVSSTTATTEAPATTSKASNGTAQDYGGYSAEAS